MRNEQGARKVGTGSVAEARLLAKQATAAIDSGSLDRAELLHAEAQQALGKPEGHGGHEVALTLALEQATIAQYRGDMNDAVALANHAVEFSDDHFGPRGIHTGRARLRRNFAREARREFTQALQANLELADELVLVAGSDRLRLNCLTRAIACAVKNADRHHQQVAGTGAWPIWHRLKQVGDFGVPRWFLFWCAIASLRQNCVDDAEALLKHASALGTRHWRWMNATRFAIGHGKTLRERTAVEGAEILRQARRDAEDRGYLGLIRSIDAGLSG